MLVECKISLGELVDKISILRIKRKFIEDPKLIKHVEFEDAVLSKQLEELKLEGIDTHLSELIEINSRLWKIEDDIRDKERNKEFDSKFIELARNVYVVNDERFRVKNLINQSFGSEIKEVKSYKKYL